MPVSVVVFAVAAFLFATPRAYAATIYYASPADQGTGDCILAENSCDLNQALTAAFNNSTDSTVLMSIGTYSGTFEFNTSYSHVFTLTGAGADAHATIIQVSGSNGVEIGTLSDINIDGVAFKNNADGPGLTVGDLVGSLTVSDSLFSGNAAQGLKVLHDAGAGTVSVTDNSFTDNLAGGFYYDDDSTDGMSVTLSGNTFTGNTSNVSGGGAYINTAADNSSVTVSDNTFDNNTSGVSGGGISASSTLDSSPILLNGNSFSGNTATSYGGGAYIFTTGTDSGATLGDGDSGHGNTFTDNTADLGAGGFYLDTDGDTSPVDVEGNTVGTAGHGNTASGGADGGGELFAGFGLTLSDNTFTDNTSDSSAGGMGVTIDHPGNTNDHSIDHNTFAGNSSDGSGGGLWVDANFGGNLKLDANKFTDNSASSGFGGGAQIVHASSGSQIIMTDNLFAGNSTASDGGGFDYYGSAAFGIDFTNNTVADNVAHGSMGGGAYFDLEAGGADFNIYNNILWGNTATTSGNDLFLSDSTYDAITINNNDLSDICTANGDCNTSDGFETNYHEADNKSSDPDFTDADAADYTLTDLSPGVNAGDDAAPSVPSTLDLGGNTRVQGAHIDMGAYEVHIGAPYVLTEITSVPAEVSGSQCKYDFSVSGTGYGEYIVQTCGGSSSIHLTVITDHPEAQEAVISGLTSGQTYTCSITVESLAGDSNTLTIGPFTAAYSNVIGYLPSHSKPADCPNNELIKYAGSPIVYLIEDCQKRAFVSGEAFLGLGYSWANIVVISDTEVYPSGPDMAVLPAPLPAAPAAKITIDLSMGMTDPQVLVLQQILQAQGFFPATQTPIEHFGPITLAAVKAYQAANGISQTGYVGPLTRAKLNS
mgnify:CR=1 FL=1